MKLRHSLGLVAAAVVTLTAALPAQAQQVVLKVHHFLPGTSNVHVNIIQAWCDKVGKESADKLKCQIYPAMQLGGTPAQLFDQAKRRRGRHRLDHPDLLGRPLHQVGGLRVAVPDAQREGLEPGLLELRAEERAR